MQRQGQQLPTYAGSYSSSVDVASLKMCRCMKLTVYPVDGTLSVPFFTILASARLDVRAVIIGVDIIIQWTAR